MTLDPFFIPTLIGFPRLQHAEDSPMALLDESPMIESSVATPISSRPTFHPRYIRLPKQGVTNSLYNNK